jgi:hypothetical protein
MRILLGVVVTLLVAGCAVAPEGTSLARVGESVHHIDHPEYVQVERAADFAGTHPRRVLSDAAQQHLNADVSLCEAMAKSAASLRDYREGLSGRPWRPGSGAGRRSWRTVSTSTAWRARPAGWTAAN